MNLRTLPLFYLLLTLPLSAASETPPNTFSKSIWSRFLHPFSHDDPQITPIPGLKATDFKNLQIGLKIDPSTGKLSEVRELKLTVTLLNQDRKLIRLDFPTTQRISALIKNSAGKVILNWADDQKFTPEPSLVVINPQERLEYLLTLSTRDFVAGETYFIEAFFPNFEKLRTSKSLTLTK